MKLILVRHGHDLSPEHPEAEHRLSRQGEQQARDIGEKLVALGITEIDIAMSSQEKRCVETLDQIQTTVTLLERRTSRRLNSEPRSNDLTAELLDCWENQHQTVLCVSHEPSLSDAVLSWCGLPENGAPESSPDPWVLMRGEAMIVSPERAEPPYDIKLDPDSITILGRQRGLPFNNSIARAGVF